MKNFPKSAMCDFDFAQFWNELKVITTMPAHIILITLFWLSCVAGAHRFELDLSGGAGEWSTSNSNGKEGLDTSNSNGKEGLDTSNSNVKEGLETLLLFIHLVFFI